MEVHFTRCHVVTLLKDGSSDSTKMLPLAFERASSRTNRKGINLISGQVSSKALVYGKPIEQFIASVISMVHHFQIILSRA